MKKIVFICFLPIILLANFNSDKYDKQVKLLKSIDVDVSYLKNESFVKIFDTMNKTDVYFFAKVLNAANINIPIIKAILKREDVPDVFLYLSMIESNFNNNAKSHVNATGAWQFMESTAKTFHLRIDKYVDERKDIVASSTAAAKYLKKLKQKFGKWYLTIFAYNCGDGCVRRAIKKAGTDDVMVLLDEKKRYLPKETRNYFKRIVSTSLIAENDIAKYGDVYLLNQIMSLNVSKVEIKPRQSLYLIAKRAEIPYSQFKKLNPHFKGYYSPPYPYHVYLPIEKIAVYKHNLNPKNYAKKHIKDVKIYRVQAGDNLISLAKRFNSQSKAIMEFNELKNDRIGINQVLMIPVLEQEPVKRVNHLKAAKKPAKAPKKVKKHPNAKADKK